MERASRETWAKRVERWRASGLTALEFAAELGINARSLRWWKWELGRKAAKKALPRAQKKRAIAPAVSPLTFVEMSAPSRNAEPFEVLLPSGVSVRVPASFDASTLERLISVLEARR